MVNQDSRRHDLVGGKRSHARHLSNLGDHGFGRHGHDRIEVSRGQTIDQVAQHVGAIGGVQQKMAGARKAGATVFLVPKDNCAEALQAVPKGLRLVKVSTLSGAVDAIKAIRDGGSNVPSC